MFRMHRTREFSETRAHSTFVAQLASQRTKTIEHPGAWTEGAQLLLRHVIFR